MTKDKNVLFFFIKSNLHMYQNSSVTMSYAISHIKWSDNLLASESAE